MKKSFPLTGKQNPCYSKPQDTFHKVQFLEIDKITGVDAVLGIEFLESFDECTFTFYPTKTLILKLKGAKTMVLPLYTKKSTEEHPAKHGASTQENTDTALNPKPRGNHCK